MSSCDVLSAAPLCLCVIAGALDKGIPLRTFAVCGRFEARRSTRDHARACCVSTAAGLSAAF